MKESKVTFRTTEAFLQSVIDAVAEPIVVIGLDHHVTLLNRAAREFWSEYDDATKDLLCYEVSHGRTTPCSGVEHPCPLQEARTTGRPITVVHEHCRPIGEPRFVEIVAAPLFGPDGAFLGIVEATRDITERAAATHKLGGQPEHDACLDDHLAWFAHQVTQSIHGVLDKASPE